MSNNKITDETAVESYKIERICHILRYDIIMFLLQYLNDHKIGELYLRCVYDQIDISKVSRFNISIEPWANGYMLSIDYCMQFYSYDEIDKLRDRLIELERNNDGN